MTLPSWLTGKTALAAAGMFGLALYQVSQAQYEQAIQSVIAIVGMLGLRHAIAKDSPTISGLAPRAPDGSP